MIPAGSSAGVRREEEFRGGGAESIAGVLGQCQALAHLNLSNNEIGPDGSESLARVLDQCTALTS